MRFKIYYDDLFKRIIVNVLRDSFNTETGIPETRNKDKQHVYFPIPEKYRQELSDVLNEMIITPEMDQEIQNINDKIKDLTDQRNELISNIRLEKNPEIIKTCRKFRDERAEEFI